ncbi:universal stress protein [Maribacter sp. 2307ULW6-5]|uniref:universal stress protein n=1 Tax=Maribacter sp. 2307ULW6-5 TaxID=3386275 RepID=UPI0039BC73C3
MKKILVPTDFSENALNALIYAAHLCELQKCEFQIMHAYADEVYRKEALQANQDLEAIKAGEREAVDRNFEALRKKLHQRSPKLGHRFTFVPVYASLVDGVNDWVTQEDVDLIVMGTRGAANNRGHTFGSNTLQVLKYAHCPVLAVPEGYNHKTIERMLFPTNYLVPYKMRELQLLGQITSTSIAKIHVLYIDPIAKLSARQSENKKLLEKYLAASQISFGTTEEKDKTLAITKHVVHHKTDLLVIVNSRHSYMEDMLQQSTIDQLGLHIKIPFLVLQNIMR